MWPMGLLFVFCNLLSFCNMYIIKETLFWILLYYIENFNSVSLQHIQPNFIMCDLVTVASTMTVPLPLPPQILLHKFYNYNLQFFTYDLNFSANLLNVYTTCVWVLKRLSTIEPCKIEYLCSKVLLIFLSFVNILEIFHLLYLCGKIPYIIILFTKWQNLF